MNRCRLFLALALWLCLAGGCLPVHGQTSTSQIVGQVADQSGAVVPQVKITVTNLATNVTLTLSSNEQGLYRALVPPGSYQVKAEIAGFRSFRFSPVNVLVDEIRKVDIALTVGETTEVVEVSAQATAIET